MPADPERLIGFAERLADAAGSAIRPYFRQPVAIDSKADASPVTIADRAAEQAMRELIEAEFPDHGILGEEFGTVRGDAEYLWVLDPIDGTKSFITGVPLFGTLVALMRNGRPMLGVVDQPIARERWIGRAGHPTTLNGRPVHARACASLDQAVIFTTSTEMFTAADAERFARLQRRARLVRYSADCYAFALLATGFVDLALEAGTKPYDWAALVPVVEGAGGRLTDWRGEPLTLESDGRLLAAGDAGLHRAALELLGQDRAA